LKRFSQTIKQDSFKITGFELDCQSLAFVFDYIKHSKTIVKIVLDGNALGIEGIKKLADLVSTSNIKELSLVSVGIGNKEASILFEALAVRLSIKKLNVSSIEGILKNKITSEGV
jgi:Ran GTPase-activating protein (RanGAP) involved in mRNA processing and transport